MNPQKTNSHSMKIENINVKINSAFDTESKTLDDILFSVVSKQLKENLHEHKP